MLSGTSHLAEKHKAGNNNQGAQSRHCPVVEKHQACQKALTCFTNADQQQLQVCQAWQSILQASGVLGLFTHGQPLHSGLWLADNMSSPAAQPGALGNGPATSHQGFPSPACTHLLQSLGDSWLPMHWIPPGRQAGEHATRPGLLLACRKALPTLPEACLGGAGI